MQSPASSRLWLNLTCCFLVVLVVAVGDLLLPCGMLSIPAAHSAFLQHCVLDRPDKLCSDLFISQCVIMADVVLPRQVSSCTIRHLCMCKQQVCVQAFRLFSAMHVKSPLSWLMVCCYKLKRAGTAVCISDLSVDSAYKIDSAYKTEVKGHEVLLRLCAT